MGEFYVYLHLDHETQEVVYVGKGHYGRAWDVTRCRSQHHEHQEWMKQQSAKGHLPCDWVQIIHRGLSEEQAYAKEKEYLHTNGVVKFCRQSGERQHRAVLTDRQALEIFNLAWEGKELHKDIAARYKTSRTNISQIKYKKQWRAVLAGVTHANQ